MVKLSKATKEKVLTAAVKGQSHRQIAQNVGISKASVTRIISTVNIHIPASKRGRPPIVDSTVEEFLVTKIIISQTQNVTTATRLLNEKTGVKISSSYATRLMGHQLKCMKRLSKPKLLLRYKEARLRFCCRNEGRGYEDWDYHL